MGSLRKHLRSGLTVALALPAICLAVAACGGGPEETMRQQPAEAHSGRVLVAQVGTRPIDGDELRAWMVERWGNAVGQYDELSEKRELLEELIDRELVAR